MNWNEIYDKIDKKLMAECSRHSGKIPYIAKNGIYNDMLKDDPSFWTNGFWAGLLWQMYHASKKEGYRNTAEESDRYLGLHHDVGFQYLLSSGANYRLTGNEKARTQALHAATVLAGRFNPTGNFIRAWNRKKGNDAIDVTGWLIIDCLMNLPLLYFASQEYGDPRFSQIAMLHTDTALRVLQRPDGSCNHIAGLDPATGELLETPGGQGYTDGSSWSRGQAWAIYGFALAFRHTKKQEYLDAAKRTAHYFLANVALTGYLSLSDFRAPKEPVYWDLSASTCAACGLLELSELVCGYEKELYRCHAERILAAVTEHCDFDPETDGMVQNCTVTYGHLEDTHASVIYADYFYTEAVLRLLNKSFLIW